MLRLIPQDKIPESLWVQKDKVLRLPHSIISSWKSILEEKNLLEKAVKERGDGETGGIDEDSTNNHYCFRYNGSCARFQLTFLDPFEDLKEVSNAFVKSLAGNNVFISDIPSGTGAASLTMLSNIAQLREEKVLPSLPLKVTILAGEISIHALSIFEKAFKNLEPYFNDYGITVVLKSQIWNIRDEDSTSRLTKEITLMGSQASDRIMLLANFTGFLEQEEKWDEVKERFEEMFRHFSGASTIAIWLEPGMKIVTNQFWPRVIKWFKHKFKSLIGSQEDIKLESSSAHYYHGLRDEKLRTNVTVVKFNTERIYG